MLEIEFEKAIVDLAHIFGWRVASFRPAGTGKGWRTPVKYDGKGYPDLTLVHAEQGQIIFAEIKASKGVLSDEQRAWGVALEAACAISDHLYRQWRPGDGDEIATVLSFGKVTSWTP